MHKAVSGHEPDKDGALFHSISNNYTEGSQKAVASDGVYKKVQEYSQKLGVKIEAHSLRATAVTNTFDNQADIAKVGESEQRYQNRHRNLP